VRVSLFSGEAELKNLFLGNPKGFESPQAMNVASIFINVDEKSLAGDTIIIDKIEVVSPEITYEKIRGTDNFQTILDNVKKAVGGDQSTAKTAEKGKKDEGKKILIKNFIVRNGKVNLAMSILGGQKLSADLPDIHLKDIGQKKGGTSPEDAFKEVFGALYAKIKSPAVTNVFSQGLDKLGIQTKPAVEALQKQTESAAEGAKQTVKAATDKLKGLFGK
jgi:uncharacterized protein involved in outer membrane biogenesis